MRQIGRGTVLFPNGSGVAKPNGAVAAPSVASAGESAYGQILHDALVPEGIHVGPLITRGVIDGDDPLFASDSLADSGGIHAEPASSRAIVGSSE